ncbi:PREDICTED: histone-lysine N-methyltransferase, H3 lysine-9 specific SUVH5-like [Ipomoea nil]|uniref:histone-lysine N-methyltransferase, H3 lysine-9 specific SUVH5-like n=1 Tax=Ipomoea nil TaxID=35883 RepID=UPI000900B49B|nr:PREDICTED: histone-lysine N-methyltransferase, H3 lysine-9 specific SUVH5-like [Ipomoea nil]
MAKRDEGGCESKVFRKNDGRNASKRDEKHGCSRSSRKKTSKIKKWRREYISYVTKMRGGSRNSGKNQGGASMADERERVTERGGSINLGKNQGGASMAADERERVTERGGSINLGKNQGGASMADERERERVTERGGSRNLGKNQGGASMADERERERVTELLSKFRAICKNLSQENKTQRETKASESSVMRIDILAAKEVKKMRSLYTPRTNSPGPIPGVEVGDTFRYRMELNLVGLHSHLQKGIDFVSNGAGERIATSVVASGGYANETSDPNVLIYCGQGGDMVSGVQNEDQSLNNPGNSALKNSIRVKNPVRVIRGTKERPSSSYATTFVYDGLYEVVAFWRDTSRSGKLLYKFKLVRITTGSS